MPFLWKNLLIIGGVVTILVLITLTFLVLTNPLPLQNVPGCNYSPQNIEQKIRGVWRENRKKLLSLPFIRSGIIYLEGYAIRYRNANVEFPFRQESNFMYLSGVDLPDCRLVIEVSAGICTLFVPRPDEKYGVWVGHILTKDQLKEKYDVDNVQYVDDLPTFFQNMSSKIDTVYVLHDKVELPIANHSRNFTVDSTLLKKSLNVARTVKSEKEIVMMKFAADVSSEAHKTVMMSCRPEMFEYQLESLFLYNISFCGLRQPAYLSIVGSGPNSAYLHYSSNERQIKDGDLVLVDAGGEYLGYATDITRTFPANGRFTENQKLIYNIVLMAHKNAAALLAPGAVWSNITETASRTIAQGLIDAGFVNGSVDDILRHEIVRVFMPHGLGHFVGLDVHDTTVRPEGPLEEGMVLTIEPGVYFNRTALANALESESKRKFLNGQMIEQFKDFGGVRIEDTFLITSNGSQSLISVPKEIGDIELLMNP
jgi:Xaa-Pro dipeptidase